MNLPELCIKRPVMTTLLMAALLVFGFAAYRQLPVSELPNVDFPTINVTAKLPGASPETMASSVATPLEQEFSTIDGIDSMVSQSSLGRTQVTITFKLDKDINVAAQDVQSALTTVLRKLPDLPSPPSFRKSNPSNAAIFYLALSSPTLPLSQVDEYAENRLAQRISMVPGVAEVSVHGAHKFAVRVQVNPDALASRNIGIDELRKAVDTANVNLPVGSFDGPHKTTTIQTTGQLFDPQSYAHQIIAYRNGAPVRLGELGRVIASTDNDKQAAWYDDGRSVILAIQRQPGANTIEVVDAIKELLPGFQQELPASVRLNVLYDRTDSIRASIDDVQFTLLLAAALVVMVIFLFLRNLSATIIPSLALPLSVVGTFGVMYFFGYSLDNLSLMALTLSVGFVVDDAIVMLENIVRHIEEGDKPMHAAIKGSREIGFTIISMTISLIAVFIPVLFMGGMLGRLLHEFAVTVCAAIAVSGLVSLTLTPMMCSRFVHHHDAAEHGSFYRATERAFNAALSGYDRTLSWCLRHHFTVLMVFLGTIVATGFLYVYVPKDFLPAEDTGRLIANTEASQDSSYDAMVRHQQELAQILLKDPNVDGFMSTVGSGGSRPSSNSGSLVIKLKPRDQRKLDIGQVQQELRRKFSRVIGITAYIRNPPAIRVGGRVSKAEYQYTLQGLDLNELYDMADKMETALSHEPGFVDVNSDADIRSPQTIIQIDRNKAGSLGVTADQIETALSSAFGSQTGQHDLHAVRPVLRDPGGRAPVPPRRDRAGASLYPLEQRRAGPDHGRHYDAARRGPDHGQPPGPVAGRDGVVQPGPRRVARHRPRPGQADRKQSQDATFGDVELPGHGSGVPEVVPGPRHAADHGHAGGLHHPRHPVRKLRPSAHHPVGPAVGRHGCPDHADRVRADAQPLLLRRHHHADRHRQEERDHDDRLCAGQSARARRRTAGSDLPRLPGPVPPDHDDHHGGHHGHAADRGRRRFRRRGAPPAGSRGGRRPDPVADADAVPDAGDLPLPRPAARLDQRAQQSPRPGSGPRAGRVAVPATKTGRAIMARPFPSSAVRAPWISRRTPPIRAESC